RHFLSASMRCRSALAARTAYVPTVYHRLLYQYSRNSTTPVFPDALPPSPPVSRAIVKLWSCKACKRNRCLARKGFGPRAENVIAPILSFGGGLSLPTA